MKKNRFMIIFIFSIMFFIMSLYLGYQLMDWNIENRYISQEEDNDRDDDIEILKEENRISPNTIIEKRIHYMECGHLVIEAELAENEVVNYTRDEYDDYLKTNYDNSRLVSFSNEKVIVYSEKNHLCQEHYIVGEHNGYIAIFNIDENGERVLYKSFTDYPINILIELDQKNLRDGIRVDSEEGLSDILENFIS